MINITVIEAGFSVNLSFDDSVSVERMLRSMNKFPDAYIVVKGELPIPITECIRDGDTVRIIRVASGG